MGYRYEDLGDKKFQDLCSALIAHINNTAQLPPTGQKDGGYDAFLRTPGDIVKFTAVQVKFTAFPDRVKSPVGWLLKVLEGEREKIEEMARSGTKDYLLITNVRSTAVPGVGRIDRMDRELKALGNAVGLRMHVWWRNDLDRRLDGAPPALKFEYPEMLVGPTAMLALMDGALEAGSLRKQSQLIRSVARTQADADRTVGFRQGRLDGIPLDDLFVDVPLRKSVPAMDDGPSNGAFAFLVKPSAPHLMMLFGAPGQGKSTLVQRLCQEHRKRLLDGDIGGDAARVVFKIVLRDYATWLAGHDPFAATKKKRPADALDSVEHYAAHMYSVASGSVSCTAEDVDAIGRRYPTLFAFDGLDEVADRTQRDRVVDEIQAFKSRSDEWETTTQLLVTSRPSFDQLPEPDLVFTKYVLQPLTEKLRLDYLHRWAASQGLSQQDRDNVERVFRERSGDAHVRELATNPMQLTILLYLIHHRGDSVPEKRTLLYKDYLSSFLDREATKWELLKTHRPEVESITAFLGWHLQAAAENRSENGREGREQLIHATKHFLVDNDDAHALETVDELFNTVVARVWALTSRVSGTFEFDVQSIREYFAALFLYERAPTTGGGGNVFERFQHLAARPYWLNVARFMAGMFRWGEKAQLADDLVATIERAPTQFWPRQIATTLLRDGVFDDHQPARKRVVHAAFDELGVRRAVEERLNDPDSALPSGRGAEELCELLRHEIVATPDDPISGARVQLLSLHQPPAELAAWWLDVAGSQSEHIDRWLELGGYLAVGAHLPGHEFESYGPWSPTRASLAMRAGAAAATGSELSDAMLASLLAGYAHVKAGPPRSLAPAVAGFVDVADLASLGEGLSVRKDDRASLTRLRRLDQSLADALQTARRVKRGQTRTTSNFADLADQLQRRLGRSFYANAVALAGASISQLRTGHNAEKNATAFGADSTPSALIRDVRAHRNDTSWWEDSPTGFSDQTDWMTWLLAVLTCAEAAPQSVALRRHGRRLGTLDPHLFDNIWRVLTQFHHSASSHRFPLKLVSSMADINPDLAVLLVATSVVTAEADVDAIASVPIDKVKSKIGRDSLAFERWMAFGSHDTVTPDLAELLVNASPDTDFVATKEWAMPRDLAAATTSRSPWELLRWRDRLNAGTDAPSLSSVAESERWLR